MRYTAAGSRPDPKSNGMDYMVLYAKPHPTVLGILKAAPARPYLPTALPTAL